MADAVSRTVRLGSMAYVDPDGRVRRADCGAEILVHPDHVARFDRLNVLSVAEPSGPVDDPAPVPDTPEPVKRRPGRPRKAESED